MSCNLQDWIRVGAMNQTHWAGFWSAPAEPGPCTNLCREFEFRKNARPHPGPLPEERESRRPTLNTLPITLAVGAILRFVSEAVRPPNAFLSATRGRTIHPLLGERAGVRASVPLTFLSVLHSNTSRSPTGPAHFAESIAFAPDFQGIDSSTVNLSAMRMKCRAERSVDGAFLCGQALIDHAKAASRFRCRRIPKPGRTSGRFMRRGRANLSVNRYHEPHKT
jgi:hypothetical protein